MVCTCCVHGVYLLCTWCVHLVFLFFEFFFLFNLTYICSVFNLNDINSKFSQRQLFLKNPIGCCEYWHKKISIPSRCDFGYFSMDYENLTESIKLCLIFLYRVLKKLVILQFVNV